MSRAEGRDEPSRLIVGRLGRAVGLRGEIEVAVLSDAPDRFAVGSRLLLSESERVVTIRSSRKQNARTIIAFDDVDDRTGAEMLGGAALYIEGSAARSLDEGEFWDHDLLGCTVVTVDGEQVGTVTDVLHQPTGELLVVGKHLIPLVSDVVREVVPRERITVDPIPGLLD